jgi:serine/threonine protein kinase
LLQTYESINRTFYSKPGNKKRTKINPSSNNTADSDGHFKLKVGAMLNERYKVVRTLGKGSFGIVLDCEDTLSPNRRSVAIKVIRAKLAFLVQAQNEIRILQELSGIMEERDLHSRSIVMLEEHFMHGEHQCMVFERMQCNLYEHLHATNFKGVPLSHVSDMGATVLDALAVLYSMQDPIIHADIKPENVLYTRTANGGHDVKLADFGSACKNSSEQRATYIQSRFYRSPEVLMGVEYGPAVDMWSLACMLMEMYTGRVLFQGTSSQAQMVSIRRVCGLPPDSVLGRCSPEKAKVMFGLDARRSSPPSSGSFPTPLGSEDQDSTALRAALSTLCSRKLPKQLQTTAEAAKQDAFLDVLVQLLVYDPSKRLTPKQARALPFFEQEPRQSSSQTQ